MLVRLVPPPSSLVLLCEALSFSRRGSVDLRVSPGGQSPLSGETALTAALSLGREAEAEAMVEEGGADLFAVNAAGETPMHVAARKVWACCCCYVCQVSSCSYSY